MAWATSRPSFTFHLSQLCPSKPPRFHSSKVAFLPIHSPRKFHVITCSVDVSKEDKPPISSSEQENPAAAAAAAASVEVPTEEEKQPEEKKFDKRRLEEKFAVLNTGIYECRSCGYKFDEAVGDPSYPIPPGYPFDKLPDNWRCPTCGAAQSFFESKRVEIAGFAQNQQYGLGGNTLTSGQKAVLIYGSLFFFFILFLAGYFLQ